MGGLCALTHFPFLLPACVLSPPHTPVAYCRRSHDVAGGSEMLHQVNLGGVLIFYEKMLFDEFVSCN